MAKTYEPIATTTLTSAQSSVTFSSLPQTYTDLVVVGYLVEDTGGNNNALMRFNGDSGTNYSLTQISGDGSSAASARATNATGLGVSYGNATSGRTPFFTIQIMNYANTTTYKTSLNRNNSGASGGWTAAQVQLWRNTAAITSISFTTTNTNFGAGTYFNLYGIKAA